MGSAQERLGTEMAMGVVRYLPLLPINDIPRLSDCLEKCPHMLPFFRRKPLTMGFEHCHWSTANKAVHNHNQIVFIV